MDCAKDIGRAGPAGFFKVMILTVDNLLKKFQSDMEKF